MHEYSLVEALIRKVEEEARARHALTVHRLSVRLGELAGVERGLFETAYSTFREGTACAGAELEVRSVPASWACTRCGQPIGRGAALTCAACGGPARLVAGDELVLDHIEMEVP